MRNPYGPVPTALRRVRHAADWNLVEVARATGVPMVEISRAEHGEDVLSATLARLCRFYGLDPATGEPVTPPAAAMAAVFADLSSYDGPAVLDLPDC